MIPAAPSEALSEIPPALSAAPETSEAVVLHSAVIAAERPALVPPAHKNSAEQAALRQQIALQRAAAEQARRTADCLRDFQETLLATLTQPCCMVDSDLRVTRWNPAMADWTGLSAASVRNRPLHQIFLLSHADILTEAIQTVRKSGAKSEPAKESISGETLPACVGRSAADFDVLPLFRVPGCLEAFLILLRPLP